MSSLAQRALGGAAATLLWQGARVLLLVTSIAVLSRLLSPADFGLVAMVTALIGVAEILRDFGLSVAALQVKNLSPEEKSNLFWLNSLIGAALTAAVFCMSWPISALYGDARLIAITQAMSITFLINGVATQFKAQINRDLRFWALGAVETVPQALAISAAITIAASTNSYWALVLQPILAASLEALMCVLASRWRPGFYKRHIPVAHFLRFAGSLAGTQTLAYASKNIDSVLLGVTRGPTELGMYNRAYQIVVLPLIQVTAPLSRVAIPVLARLQDDSAEFMRYLRTAQFATIAVTSVFYGTMIGFAEPIIRLALGENWVEAAPILQILAISGIFRALGQAPYWIFVTLGLTGKQLRIYLVGQPLIIASIAVGAIWGAVGVAVGSAIGYAAFWIVNMWWAARSTGLPIGRLALSGLGLVMILALPVAAIGVVALNVLAVRGVTTVLAGLVAGIWVCVAMLGIPFCRHELSRFARIARRRRSESEPEADSLG